MSAVRASFGPTLPALLGPRRWRVVLALAIVAGLGLVLALWESRASEQTVVVRGEPSFNFAYEAPLRKVGPATVEQRNDRGTFVQSMTVRAIELPAYDGVPEGQLPILADRLAERLDRVQRDFRLVGEGRTRVNESVGYVISWQARLGADRDVFARDYLLVPDDDESPRVGVVLELRGTHLGNVSNAEDVGRAGPLKRAFRSFRFGTERP